ncbi:MAG: signal peptide peptidase SppA [Candidatus Aminicenantes bacterium]|jgi:protease-4
MKRGTYVLIIFLIFFVLILATIISFMYFELAKPVKIKPNTYLEIKLSGTVEERPIPDFLTTFFMGGEPLSMHDIWLNFHKAKADRNIKGILLRIGMLQCDWAKVSEIRDLVLDFKTTGKKTYAYIEEALDFDKEYYLATACDRIFLHPLGALIINGIGGHVPFFKGTLDKLGIEAEIEHVEEFKTAYNMFTEKGFTPSHKEMIESIYEDIFTTYVKKVAEARGKEEREVHTLLDKGYFHSENAEKLGLVDKLVYEDQLEDILKDKEKSVSRIDHRRYLKKKVSRSGLNRGKKIALIYGVGTIHSGESMRGQTMGSSTIARWLRRARKDKTIAAVVFRVDSPGGSAVASDVIGREVALTKKEKPIIVSMSDVAGSGGYWVSMDAHQIVAQPQTLTGSIGVIFGKLNLIKLYEKLGVTAEKVAYGKRADIFSTFRKLTPEERGLLKEEILWTYDRFTTKVAQGRHLTKEEVNDIGRGRVWTGQQAKEIGLVDEIGGLSTALRIAKERAGIPEDQSVRLIVRPKKTSLFESFFALSMARTKLFADKNLGKLIRALQILEKERVLAIMPFIFVSQ